jgi:hypothetical protein
MAPSLPRFTPDGTLQQSWEAPGKTAPGEFHVPHGVWVRTDRRVLVADRENNRLQIFSPEPEVSPVSLNGQAGSWSGIRRCQREGMTDAPGSDMMRLLCGKAWH